MSYISKVRFVQFDVCFVDARGISGSSEHRNDDPRLDDQAFKHVGFEHKYVYCRLVSIGWAQGARNRVKNLHPSRVMDYIQRLHIGKWIDDDVYDSIYCIAQEKLSELGTKQKETFVFVPAQQLAEVMPEEESGLRTQETLGWVREPECERAQLEVGYIQLALRDALPETGLTLEQLAAIISYRTNVLERLGIELPVHVLKRFDGGNL